MVPAKNTRCTAHVYEPTDPRTGVRPAPHSAESTPCVGSWATVRSQSREHSWQRYRWTCAESCRACRLSKCIPTRGARAGPRAPTDTHRPRPVRTNERSGVPTVLFVAFCANERWFAKKLRLGRARVQRHHALLTTPHHATPQYCTSKRHTGLQTNQSRPSQQPQNNSKTKQPTNQPTA